jgi:hypothetical protein
LVARNGRSRRRGRFEYNTSFVLKKFEFPPKKYRSVVRIVYLFHSTPCIMACVPRQGKKRPIEQSIFTDLSRSVTTLKQAKNAHRRAQEQLDRSRKDVSALHKRRRLLDEEIIVCESKCVDNGTVVEKKRVRVQKCESKVAINRDIWTARRPITNDSDCQLAPMITIVCIFEQIWWGDFPFNLRHAVHFQRTCRDFRDGTQDYLKHHNFYYPRISTYLHNASLSLDFMPFKTTTSLRLSYDKKHKEALIIQQSMSYNRNTGPIPTLTRIKGDKKHYALLMEAHDSVFCLGGQLTANTAGSIENWNSMPTTQVVDCGSGPLCYLEPSIIVPMSINSRPIRYDPALRIQITLAGTGASSLPPCINLDTMRLSL